MSRTLRRISTWIVDYPAPAILLPLAVGLLIWSIVLLVSPGQPPPVTPAGVPTSCAHSKTAEPGSCAPPAIAKLSEPQSASQPPVAAEKRLAPAVVTQAATAPPAAPVRVVVPKLAAAATPRAVRAAAASVTPPAKRKEPLVVSLRVLIRVHHCHTYSVHPKCVRWERAYGALTGRKPSPPPAKRHVTPKPRPAVIVLRKIVDLSNNDPVSYSQLAAMKRAGVRAVILKVNQGITFADWTFVGMARNAMRLGLVVCGYDFVSTYTAAEAYKFVGLLHLAGIWRATPKTCPPTLDVEYGNATRSGIQNMLQIIWRWYGRAQEYTGNWFISRLGCWWPANVIAWLSGYPVAPVPCGLAGRLHLYLVHQFTDHGYNGATFADLSWFRGTSAAWRTYTHQ